MSYYKAQDLVYDINYELPEWLKIAKEVTAETPLKSRIFVAGAMGSTNKSPFMSLKVNDPKFPAIF